MKQLNQSSIADMPPIDYHATPNCSGGGKCKAMSCKHRTATGLPAALYARIENGECQHFEWVNECNM